MLLDRRPPTGGLMVQFGTNAEGNIALYTRADRLWFQAKGANQVSCGIDTSHQQIAHMAGVNDRSDPGTGFDYEYMFHAAKFFKANGHFVGA